MNETIFMKNNVMKSKNLVHAKQKMEILDLLFKKIKTFEYLIEDNLSDFFLNS
jgi:hypothetical protein